MPRKHDLEDVRKQYRCWFPDSPQVLPETVCGGSRASFARLRVISRGSDPGRSVRPQFPTKRVSPVMRKGPASRRGAMFRDFREDLQNRKVPKVRSVEKRCDSVKGPV